MPSTRDSTAASPTRASRRKSKAGEGEFAKVKYGIHSESGDEAAIKLIRKENVDAEKLSKIKREISVLKSLSHPYIVSLIEVIETHNFIGIVLEYASGGELFDHILAHRYLKEREACRLFAQLICGVDYLHNNKIIHRDLKLENLLLDRNRNIIVTDFGFANQFGKTGEDLMATSCGSPCYAAPELVVSDGMYAGSAVDIWSCGVILYAMLAGYLPFDDDPDNPDGDNINLLYKYILSTPLSFPDYIGSDARDLLRKMLVPDPEKRCKIKDIMNHRWLAQFKTLFDEFKLQAKLSYATGVLPPADTDIKSEVKDKSKRHTLHIEASPKMIDTNLKKDKQNIGTAPGTPIPEEKFDLLPPELKSNNHAQSHGHPHGSLGFQQGGIIIEDNVSFQRLLPEASQTRDASDSSAFIPTPINPTMDSSNPKISEFNIVNHSTNASEYPRFVPANFSESQATSKATKARPISMQPTSNRGTMDGMMHTQRYGLDPLVEYASRNHNNHSQTISTNGARHYVNQSSASNTVSFNVPTSSSVPQTPDEASRKSNRQDARKALSAVLDSNQMPPMTIPIPMPEHRKSTMSPTGTAAKRITDWIKRKSVHMRNTPINVGVHENDPPTVNVTGGITGPIPPNAVPDYKLRYHRGPVDYFALTSLNPPVAIAKVHQTLIELGFLIERGSDFKFKISRPHRTNPNQPAPSASKRFMMLGLRGLLNRKSKNSTPASEAENQVPDTLYGDMSIDNGEEVKLSVELCKVKNFYNLYVLDVKRLKGNVWSYKFLYHQLLEALQFQGAHLNGLV